MEADGGRTEACRVRVTKTARRLIQIELGNGVSDCGGIARFEV